jgi:Clp amino terminal domain, pathogenicity island component
MLERSTPEFRYSLVVAQEEARARGANQLAPEHMLAEGASVGARVLIELGAPVPPPAEERRRWFRRN